MKNTLKLYLFPQSLYFVDYHPSYTKAQRSRMAIRLTSGDQISFLADKNDVIFHFEKALTLRKKLFSETRTIDASFYQYFLISWLFLQIEAYAVISNETPRRIWCDSFGLINYTENVMHYVPNIVYNITVAMDVFFREYVFDNKIPIPYLKYELGSIVGPFIGNDYIDLIYSAVKFFFNTNHNCTIIFASILKIFYKSVDILEFFSANMFFVGFCLNFSCKIVFLT